MNKYLKILVSDGLIYGFAAVITKFVHIFLVPLYTTALTEYQYGQFSMVNTALAILSVLIYFGMESAVSLFYYQAETEETKNKVFANWIAFMLSVSGTLALLLFLFRTTLAQFLFGSTDLVGYIDILAINNLFFGLQYIAIVFFRYRRMPWHAVSMALLMTGFTLIGNYYFVNILRLDITGILYSHLLVSISLFLVSGTLLRQCLKPSLLDISLVKEMVSFSFPLVPAAILRFTLMYSIVFFIDNMISKESLGIYQVGSTLSGLVRLYIVAFMIPWNTIWYNISREKNANSIYAGVLNFFLSIGVFMCIILVLFGEVILDFVANERYLNSLSVLGLLALNHILLAVPQITLVGSAIKKDNKPYLYSVSVGVIVSLIALYLLTPMYGIRGACYGMILGNIVVQSVLIFLVNRINKITYDYFYLVVVLTFGLVIESAIHNNYVDSLLGRILCAMIFILGIGFYNRDYIHKLPLKIR